MPDSFSVLDFHERAVRTPSHEDVTEMRELLVATLREHGDDPAVDDAGNVLASKGTGEPHVVLNTHIDTVPPHVDFARDGDVVEGRGSCDAKGPLAALLAAFFAVDADEGKVTLAITPDEETDSMGAAALDLDADGFIVGEPTNLDACTSARGRFQGTVELAGEGAHAAEPETGANAVAAAEQALEAVRTYDAARGAAEHPELGPPTLTPTRIVGGDAANRVPDDCTIVFDRRTVPPETQTEFFDGFAAHVREEVPEHVGVAVEPAERETPFLEAFDTPDDSAVVEALVDAGAGSPRPFGAATEASYFAADAPTVVFGPGVLADDEGPVAHAQREYVHRSDVERAAEIVTDALDALV
ncbi:M20/M25/M40 family metallo-hydrolase [Halobacterium sp. KA-4]|uniref:M20/M25/M40 family metallo-hydrolase n=1 Tax=Halobacterium sp. KA-4 TaxID=2896367 RepID=UPI001E3AE151|nr:M20/M25/M40 family metallo-hydrolase [Halobacterium sp. KA-4]MCD2198415.1 M20/M25/M40 family metallo-hydrolase [Halobacterium sp. KA-4]